MALFGGAALAAGLTVTLAWFPPHPNQPFGFRVLDVANAGVAAGLSAAIAFWLLNRLGLRLTRGPWPLRAVLLAAAALVTGHLLFGFVYSVFVLVESAILPALPYLGIQGFLFYAFQMGMFAVIVGWSFSLPGGFAAALLLEWLETRQSQAPNDPDQAVE